MLIRHRCVEQMSQWKRSQDCLADLPVPGLALAVVASATRYSILSFALAGRCAGEMVSALQEGWNAVLAMHAQYKLRRFPLI